MKKIKFILFLFLLYSISAFPARAGIIDCSPPLSGNYSLTGSDDCLWANSVDGVDAGSDPAINTAQITIGTGRTMTVQANQTIAFGQINLQSGATLAISQTNAKMQKGPLWIKDTDTDGYPDSLTLNSTYAKVQNSQPAGFVRKNTLATLSNADCAISDNTRWRTTTLYADLDDDGYGSSSANTSRRSSASNSGSGTSITITKPSGTALGDVMIAAVSFGGLTTVTPPSGWTLAKRQDLDDVSSNDVSTAVYYKAAGASEPANYSFTFGISLSSVGIIVTYTNVAHSNLVDSSDGQTNGVSTATTTTFQTPSITSGNDNSILVGFHGLYTGAATWTANGNMTEITEIAAGSRSIQGVDYLQSSAGSSGTTNSTSSISGYGASVILFLRPAAGSQCLGVSSETGSSENNTDCYDSNVNAHPGQTSYFTTSRGDGSYDYDCNSAGNKNPSYDCIESYSGARTCTNGVISGTAGYSLSVPSCGASGTWVYCIGYSASPCAGTQYSGINDPCGTGCPTGSSITWNDTTTTKTMPCR